jgi:hypothetical protein
MFVEISMSQWRATTGVLAGVALLATAALRESGNFLRALLGFCVVFYFALGNFKPIAISRAEVGGSRGALHQRPGFAQFVRNSVLSRHKS